MELKLEHQLDAQWIIALWLFIHGGDPGPGENSISEEIASAVAAQVFLALSPYLKGTGAEKIVKEVASLAATWPQPPTPMPQLISALNSFGFKLFAHDGSEHREITPQNAVVGPPPPRTCICVRLGGEQRCNSIPLNS